MPFVIETLQTESFDTLKELEHYVKEHSPLEFDDKVTLLRDKAVVIADEDEGIDVYIKITEKKEKEE